MNITHPATFIPLTIGLALFVACAGYVIRHSANAVSKFAAFIGNHKRAVFAVLPIVGCNGTAFAGQLFFFRDHAKSWPEAGVILFAATMESIALYLASEAAEREKKNVASFNVRMASYGFGLFVGMINYSHYANHNFAPTVFALIFGSMSALSPWLWALYGRGQAYEIQLERGLIEPRGVKFARIRWILWPKETFAAMRLAAWSGERNPEQAIKDYELLRAAKQAKAEALETAKRLELESAEQREAAEREAREHAEAAIRNELESCESQAELIRVAFRYAGTTTANKIVAWLAARGYPDVSPANVRTVKNRASEQDRNAGNAEGKGLHVV